MMTLKLVGEGRTRIFEAASFTITEECAAAPVANSSRKISAHDLVGDQGVSCWWIGFPPYEVDDHRVYSTAYLMNSAGKTVECISTPVMGAPGQQAQQQRRAA